jgi:hypothetical protein
MAMMLFILLACIDYVDSDDGLITLPFMLYAHKVVKSIIPSASMISVPLVSLVGFCCFVKSVWNNNSTIKNLKNQLDIHEIELEIHKTDMKSLVKSTEGSIITKVIAYVWATAITLLLSYAGWVAAPQISPYSGDYFLLLFALLGSPVGFCCFVWTAWNDYSTIRRLKSQVKIYEEKEKSGEICQDGLQLS